MLFVVYQLNEISFFVQYSILDAIALHMPMHVRPILPEYANIVHQHWVLANMISIHHVSCNVVFRPAAILKLYANDQYDVYNSHDIVDSHRVVNHVAVEHLVLNEVLKMLRFN